MPLEGVSIRMYTLMTLPETVSGGYTGFWQGTMLCVLLKIQYLNATTQFLPPMMLQRSHRSPVHSPAAAQAHSELLLYGCVGDDGIPQC